LRSRGEERMSMVVDDGGGVNGFDEVIHLGQQRIEPFP
jgi:hypothetical protein